MQLILLLETTERWQTTDFLFTQSIAVPSSLARQVEVFVVNNHLTDGVSFNLESCWSRSVFICHHGHIRLIEGVAHIQF